MPKISLASYVLRIKDMNTGNYLQLDKFLPKEDFLNFIKDYFNFIQSQIDNDIENKKLIRIKGQTIKVDSRQINGVIETGEYGYESEIIDNLDGSLKYSRKTSDAEMMPFYFLMSLPVDKDKGIVVLERFGLLGISKVFRNSLNQFLKSKNPDLILEFNPLVPTDTVSEFLDKGNVTKLIFRKFGIPSDLSNYFDTSNNETSEGYVEFRIVAKRKHNLPVKNYLLNFFSSKQSGSRLMEINNIEYDRVKVEVKLGKDTRTIDLSNFNTFRPYYDVSSEVRLGKNGHPDFDSINSVANSLLNELNDILYPLQNVR
jgi:hypothetical protein